MSDYSGQILTVDGSIEPEDLGKTITHEHTFIDMKNWGVEPKSAYERKLAEEPVSLDNLWFVRRGYKNKDNLKVESLETAIDEIGRYHRVGGDSIVDVTPKGAGYDPRRVREVSRETGVQMVHGTSYYVRSAHPEHIEKRDIDDIKKEFVSDVTDGIDDTQIKAGIIGEIGLSTDKNVEIYEVEEKVLRAGVRAALETGASLTLHPPGSMKRSWKGGKYPTARWALDILDIVEEEGLPAERVVMGHMDRSLSSDPEYQLKLAKTGVYLEYDLWGTGMAIQSWVGSEDDGYPSDKWRTETIKTLIQEGHTSQILVSHDVCRKIQLIKYGGMGYSHFLESGIPMLMEHGITKEQIDTILIDNPRELLTFE